ncbi:MAG TPA: Rpn family recombination-promoting nuclease/putative transposase [Thermoanaerobaculia bacterium]
MQTPSPERHDGSYRLLFSHPRMVEDLLRGYLPEVVGAGDLEKGNGVYLSDRLERREQDLVWRLHGPEGPLYLLLEFQSEPDPRMDLRSSVYSGLFLQDLIRSGEISRSAVDLPPVLCVVLYNGPGRWTESPDAPFRLIDVSRAPLPSDPDNLVRLLFELERSRTSDELEEPIERLSRLLTGPEHADLRRAFLAFLKESLLPGRFPGARISAIIGLEEIRPMLRHTVMEWTREWKSDGQREGESRFLLRQLELKFGAIRSSDRARIDAADSETRLRWAERILTARSLDEVFAS